jgi:hypothetical protein
MTLRGIACEYGRWMDHVQWQASVLTVEPCFCYHFKSNPEIHLSVISASLQSSKTVFKKFPRQNYLYISCFFHAARSCNLDFTTLTIY